MFAFMKRRQIFNTTYNELNSLSLRELDDIGIMPFDIARISKEHANIEMGKLNAERAEKKAEKIARDHQSFMNKVTHRPLFMANQEVVRGLL